MRRYFYIDPSSLYPAGGALSNVFTTPHSTSTRRIKQYLYLLSRPNVYVRVTPSFQSHLSLFSGVQSVEAYQFSFHFLSPIMFAKSRFSVLETRAFGVAVRISRKQLPVTFLPFFGYFARFRPRTTSNVLLTYYLSAIIRAVIGASLKKSLTE